MFFFHLLPCPFDLLLTFVSLSFPSLAKTLHGISWLSSQFKSFLDLIDLTSPIRTTSVPYGEDCLKILLECHELAVNAADSSESDGLHQREKRQLILAFKMFESGKIGCALIK